MNKMNKKGFTLAELLIVVAIIGVLVAISIPVFTTQLEKSREATDLANIRSAYAEMTIKVIDNTGADVSAKTIGLKQTVNGWTTTTAADTLTKDLKLNVTGNPADSNKNQCTLSYTKPVSATAEGTFSLAFSVAS